MWQTSTIFKENQNKEHYFLKGWPLFASMSSCCIVGACLHLWGMVFQKHTTERISRKDPYLFSLLFYRWKKLRLREIKLNWFLKVIQLEEKSNFPTFGIRTLHVSTALSSQMQCLELLLTTPPRSSGTPFSGLQLMFFPTPCLRVPGDTTRWCTFAGGPDSKVGMKNGESLFFSILKFIMTLFFFSQLPWEYWF